MEKKYFQFLIFIALCIGKNTVAQNFVPNPSFENFLECPDTSTIPFYLNLDSTWFQFNSADYFNSCDGTNYISVPSNRFGYQVAHSGNAYMGFIAYIGNIFGREYIEVELINPLNTGQLYYVQFNVSLADTMQYAIENIAALFTDTLFDPFPAPNYNWVTGIPQIENTAGYMLNDKTNWVAITGSFVANGGEKFMTIGNFRTDAQTVSQYFGDPDPNTYGSYYYIDDVYVGTTPAISIHEEERQDRLVNLYPNPNNGEMTLECNLQDTENGSFVIYSLTGKIIKLIQLSSGTKSLRINVQELQAGMYLYEVRINGKESKKNKLTIIK